MKRRFPLQLTNHRYRAAVESPSHAVASGAFCNTGLPARGGIASDIESIFGGKRRQRAGTQRKARDKPGMGGCHACTMFISHGSLFRLTITVKDECIKNRLN